MDQDPVADTEPINTALAASVVLALVGLVAIEVAVVALTDWRWGALLAGAAAIYFAYVLSVKAGP